LIAASHSSSELFTAVLFGAVKRGTALSPQNLRFGDYVVSLTAPGKARMPNGMECGVLAAEDRRIAIGEGQLVIGELVILPGKAWNPVPASARVHRQPSGPLPLASGLTWISRPGSGDELLAGYVAGLVLLHRRRNRAMQIADRALEQFSPLNATLLRHAARGEVPEPIHHLLATGDPGPLLAFAPSGILWLRGLISAGLLLEGHDPAGIPATKVRAS